jgi:hypothetical protein
MRDARYEVVLRLPLAEQATSARRSRFGIGLALLAAALLVAWVVPLGWMAQIGVALFGAVAATIVARSGVRDELRTRAWLVVDASGIERRGDDRGPSAIASLVRWSEPFGVTVLSDRTRRRLLLAFTTPERTRYIAVRVTLADAFAVRELCARAATVADVDIESALGHARGALKTSDAVTLMRLLDARAPGALDRMYLSSPRGESIVLDRGTLTIGERAFDLNAPLEWRAFMFHESAGRIASIYQATWLRQGDAELVFVAMMPAEMTWGPQSSGDADAARDTLVQRAIVRDLRLMQSSPEDPPPRELRLAIDRLFMLPLRQALDTAPRATRSNVPPSRRQSEGRAS